MVKRKRYATAIRRQDMIKKRIVAENKLKHTINEKNKTKLKKNKKLKIDHKQVMAKTDIDTEYKSNKSIEKKKCDSTVSKLKELKKQIEIEKIKQTKTENKLKQFINKQIKLNKIKKIKLDSKQRISPIVAVDLNNGHKQQKPYVLKTEFSDITSKTTDNSSPIDHNQLSSCKKHITVINQKANNKHKLLLLKAATLFNDTESLNKVAKVNLVDVFNQGEMTNSTLAALCKTPKSQLVPLPQVVDIGKAVVDIVSETASVAPSVDQTKVTNRIPEASCGIASSPRVSRSRETQFVQVTETGMAATGGFLSETASQAEASKPFIATNKIEMASCKGINSRANCRASPKIQKSEAVDVIQIAKTNETVKVDRIIETASRAIATTLKLLKLLGQN